MIVATESHQGAIDMQVTTIGLDIAKNVFQVHGIDAAEKVVVRKQLRRSQVLEFFKALPPCLIIPMTDIEPAFTPLISICRELETPAGYLDNLWLIPAGGIVLGECKLVRNPQSRREAITQALDYARAICNWN